MAATETAVGEDLSGRWSPQGTASLGEHIRINVSANQGGRRYMEDRVHIECVRLPNGVVDYLYIAVYDGHGGSEASDYVRKHLLKNIQSQCGFSGNDEEMLTAIKKGFIETHLAMWKVIDDWPLTSSGYASTAGTTASCAFIRRGKVFTGHVGDSAIILGELNDNRVKAVSLTVDHKPDNVFEEQRINNAGGMVMKKSGIKRVVWTRPIRGHAGPLRRSTPTESIAFLAVARSLGDMWSYNKETKQFIVSPEPDVAVFDLSNKDMCLVLGSDGLTNVLKPQQIIDIVMYYDRVPHDKFGRLPNHSRFLLRHALESWGTLRADNISIITVIFEKTSIAFRDAPILASNINLDLEKALTDFENSMISIGPEYCHQMETLDVDLYYAGIVDSNFNSSATYSGPGFTRDVKRAVATVQLPIVPLTSVDHVTSMNRLNELFGSRDNANSVVSASCVAGVILEPILYKDAMHGDVSYPKDEDVVREETVYDNSQIDEVTAVSLSAGETCSSNLETNTNVMECKSSIATVPCSSSRKRPLTFELNGDVTNMAASVGEASSCSNYQLISSSLSSSSQLNIRPTLRVHRRITRNSDSVKIETEESNEDGKCKYEKDDDRLPTTSHRFVSQQFSSPSHTAGGASALSPALMLATLRTTNQLFEHDPYITRDMILSGRRRARSFSSDPPAKKVKISEEKIHNSVNNYENCTECTEKSEKNDASSTASKEETAPATTRSRIWDFIFSFLGNRGSSQ